MKSLQEVLTDMTGYLEGRQISAPRRWAEELLGAALKMKRLDLYLNFERPMAQGELATCRQFLKRAGAGEPLEYILGEVEFYGVKLCVDSRVLIPRPETELMVEQIVAELEGKSGTLWDLCTGSGCIGLAIKKALPNLKVICSDICPDALDLARSNAEKNNLDILFCQGDFLDAYEGCVDFLVTNPPYVLEEEMTTALGHEPRIALVGGLTFYERLAHGLPDKLRGKAWMEIGAGQGEAVKGLFSHPPYSHVTLTQDLAGLDRVISLEPLIATYRPGGAADGGQVAHIETRPGCKTRVRRDVR